MAGAQTWARCWGASIRSGATIASVTNAATVILGAAAIATASAVRVTIPTTVALCEHLADALATPESAYAQSTSWLMNPRTIGTRRKQKSTTRVPLL